MSENACVCGGDGEDDLLCAGPGAGSLVDNETGLAGELEMEMEMRRVMIYFYSGCSQQQQW